MKRVDFITKYYPVVKENFATYRLFPETVFAQAIVESSDRNGNFAANSNARNARNLFGIKSDKSWKGARYINPDVKSESNVFRKYNTFDESIIDYMRFLNSQPRYKKAGVFSASNFAEQMEALQRAGYAGTDTNYANLLKKVGASVQKVLSSAGAKVVNVAKQGADVVADNPIKFLLLGGALYLLANGRK